jgi:hypothetical protein
LNPLIELSPILNDNLVAIYALPTATNITIQAVADFPSFINLTSVPFISEHTLTFSPNAPDHGKLHLFSVSDHDAIYYYVPEQGYKGVASFRYRVTDNKTLDTNVATVSIILQKCVCNLSPIEAVELVWAYTGKFSLDEVSRTIAKTLPETDWKKLKEVRDTTMNQTQKEYLSNVLLAMEGSLRNLDIIYKGRALKFEENDKLRGGYLKSIDDSKDFGLKAGDIIKSLPGLAIGPAASIPLLLGGAHQLISVIIPPFLSALGFGITIAAAHINRGQTIREYVRIAYHKNQYYFHYVNDATIILNSLYSDIDALHEKAFGRPHLIGNTDSKVLVKDLTDRGKLSFCPHIHNHFKFKIITPELWPRCEAGWNAEGTGWTECDYWQKYFEKGEWGPFKWRRVAKKKEGK